MRGISVVIPNYNGRALLEQNLPLLFSALDKTGLAFEVIVPDDASSDDSVHFLKQNYPSIICKESAYNQGFSKNINKGIRLCNYELTFLMNSDIELTEDYFLPQIEHITEDVFGCMGSIWGREEGGKEKLQDSAKYPWFKRGKMKGTLNYQSNKICPSFFLSGANALVNTQKLKQLGGFEEIYSPFYMEDFDLGLRANRMGWKCLYIPEAKCYHPTSSTINKFHQPKAVQIIAKRNGLLLHQLHLNGIPLILFWGRNAIQLILRLFKADLVWYHAFFAFCSKLRELNSIKRKQQFNYSISEIVHSLKSEIPRDAQLF